DLLFKPIKAALKEHHCQRAVLVGHNAWFDLQFVQEACLRQKIKSPFHPFTSFDTATLAGVAYGQTVLAKAMKSAHIDFNGAEAHSALYDAKKTAELFCKILNTFKAIDKINDLK
ncbi:MAG: ribonuclease, partial [Pseudomonadota bacterium]|nr:ribonuclease [Pseudomonadota bacterium]